jgi:CBS domain-containing protein
MYYKENQLIKVRTIMAMNPACCTVDTKLVDVAQLMIDNKCGEIPVVNNHEEKRLVGVISDRDICYRAVARSLNPAAMNAKDCMTAPAIAIGMDESIFDCLELMDFQHCLRLPVVDERGCCCGMVSLADINKKTNEISSTLKSRTDLLNVNISN